MRTRASTRKHGGEGPSRPSPPRPALPGPSASTERNKHSHVRNCRYEDEGVSIGRVRTDARRHPPPPLRRRRMPSDPRQEAASPDRASLLCASPFAPNKNSPRTFQIPPRGLGEVFDGLMMEAAYNVSESLGMDVFMRGKGGGCGADAEARRLF